MARSNRSSRLAAACLGLLLLASVPAVSGIDATPQSLPTEAEVGTQMSATVELTDLYRNPNLEAWTLSGETALTEVTWTVTMYDQGGNQLTRRSYDGQTFEHDGIALAEDVSEVRVNVTGTVPPVTEYSYDPQQSVRTMVLTQTRAGGTSNEIGNWSVPQFTEGSQSARTAIERASETIATASADGADTTAAEATLEDAIEAYETRSFGLATSLAEDAEAEAQTAQQSAQWGRWLLYGVVGVVLVGAIAGGLYWYQNRETVYDRLS